MRVWKKIFYYILYIICINKIMRHDKKKVWSNILDLFFATEIYIFIYEFFFIISLLYFGFSFITRERERD